MPIQILANGTFYAIWGEIVCPAYDPITFQLYTTVLPKVSLVSVSHFTAECGVQLTPVICQLAVSAVPSTPPHHSDS